MELDDLKQGWNKQSETELKHLNNNFIEMIHNKSYGPLAVLKSKIQRQLIALVILLALIFSGFFMRPQLWYFLNFLMVCLSILAGYYWSNYTLIRKLQNIEAPVKTTIEKNIKLLQTNFIKYFVASRAYFLIAVAVIEILMWRGDKNFEIWHKYSVLIRFAIYSGIFLIFYILGKYNYRNNYAKHIAYLKKLLEEIA